jgi:hypothetical protein
LTLNADEKSEPLLGVAVSDYESEARDAELLCPENAITIVD